MTPAVNSPPPLDEALAMRTVAAALQLTGRATIAALAIVLTLFLAVATPAETLRLESP